MRRNKLENGEAVRRSRQEKPTESFPFKNKLNNPFSCFINDTHTEFSIVYISLMFSVTNELGSLKPLYY